MRRKACLPYPPAIVPGKNREAQELMYSSFVPKKEEADRRYGTYQVVGNLDMGSHILGGGECQGANRRSGNARLPARSITVVPSIAMRVAYTAFTLGGVAYRREYFISRQGCHADTS